MAEEIETIKEAMSDIFKILIVDKKDYEAVEALNLKLQDKITLISAIFTTARHEELKEVAETDRFQE